MTIYVCFYGPTGSGKTTIAREISARYDAELIKVAQPLHELQRTLYETIGKPVRGQDGELLQFLAHKIEKEEPGWLGRRFLHRVERSRHAVVLNDDCRLNSYPALKSFGFRFVRVRTSARRIAERLRHDHSAIDAGHPVEQGFERFSADQEIVNDGPLSDTLAQARRLVDALLGEESQRAAGQR